MNGVGICSIISIVVYAFFFNSSLLYTYLSILSASIALSYYFVPSTAAPYNTPSSKSLISAYGDPTSPVIHSAISVKISKALETTRGLSRAHGMNVALVHLAIKALGDLLANFHDINGRIVFGCYVPFKSSDISVRVESEDGEPHTVLIKQAENKSVIEIAKELQFLKENLRTRQPLKYFEGIPEIFAGIFLEIISVLTIVLRLQIPSLGIINQSGVVMLSDYSASNSELVHQVLNPVQRMGLCVVLTTPRETLIVENGEMKPELIMNISLTMDHRFSDGVRGSQAQEALRRLIENPQEMTLE